MSYSKDFIFIVNYYCAQQTRAFVHAKHFHPSVIQCSSLMSSLVSYEGYEVCMTADIVFTTHQFVYNL
jgi:hypothetical protein